jgi:hypothetical protein
MSWSGFTRSARRSTVGRSAFLLLAALLAVLGGILPAPRPASSQAACAGPGDFRSEDRVVMTYLYYWYDAESLDNPALTLHPPAGQPFDWRDPAWYEQQLADMAEVGVDVALAVYWGAGPTWSAAGIEQLVAARERLLEAGLRAPAIGLFLDSNLYAALLAERPELADLTGAAGLDAFADEVAGFFERVPPCHRARIDGRPLAFLWRPDTEDGNLFRFDRGTFEALYWRLEQRLGARPYLVRERTWDGHGQVDGVVVETDAAFTWGAALNGPLFADWTVAVGPGYDDRLLLDRPGYVRDRDEGRPYARDLRTAVLSGSRWLLLETWNELWEGTAIAETDRYGRAYLDLTRRYVELFHQLAPEGARDGWVDLGSGTGNYLALLAEAPQERGIPEIGAGRLGARPLIEPGDGAAYFHFALQPRLGDVVPGPVAVVVEYLDMGAGTFLLEYDSGDGEAPGEGSLKPTSEVALKGTGRWRAHTFELADADFRKRQYVGFGDFRIRDRPADGEPSHLFGRVTVMTRPGPRPILLGPENLAVAERSADRSVDVRWSNVESALHYSIELAPISANQPALRWHTATDQQFCPGGRIHLVDGRVVEHGCRLDALRAAAPGLYRWRVQGINASDEPIGEPSDWGFLLVAE